MKQPERNKQLLNYLFVGACAVLTLAIVFLLIRDIGGRKEEKNSTTPKPSQETVIRYVTKTETVYVDKLVPVEVEKTITTEILEEGLHDMGKLITEEYFFKEVTTFESTKTYVWIIHADSKLVMGYEGTITAGIDFASIRVTKDEDRKSITVILPQAELFQCSLDYTSFEVYEEDVSRANPITASDYNGSLLELQSRATSRALARGILERANTNAELLIRSFIGGLVDLKEYKLSFVVI